MRILEKQKIKMSKMAATAAIFCILTFCFSKTGTKLPALIGSATSGSQRYLYDPFVAEIAGYNQLKMGYIDQWGIVLGHVERVW